MGGVTDLSGLLKKENGAFALKTSDSGFTRNNLAATVSINDKLLLIGLQGHNLRGGVISKFNADRGGQWLLYQPRIEGDGVIAQETSITPTHYACNPFSNTMCHIHPTYKVELDAACATTTALVTTQAQSPTTVATQVTYAPTTAAPAAGHPWSSQAQLIRPMTLAAMLMGMLSMC